MVSERQVFVEKGSGFDIEARRLRDDIAAFLGPQYPALSRLSGLRIVNRYRLSGQDLDDGQFRRAVDLVFSDPRCDRIFYALPECSGAMFGVEYLPGQYDQRADSAEQCLELIFGIRPRVLCAKFYLLAGPDMNEAELAALKSYLINPVDSRECTTEREEEYTGPYAAVPVLSGFTALDAEELVKFASGYGLAMPREDLACCRGYFAGEGRDPALTELRVLDAYWSDHCRHTTFTTVLEPLHAGQADRPLRNALELYENVRREVYGEQAGKRPRTLMDIATIGAKVLKKRGLLPDLDDSKEINACTVKITARFELISESGEKSIMEEPWLLLFKNETHNHPTEIEPFGGAATCLGGAIRDPLSGRAFVYQAMRVSGGGDPYTAMACTMPGKLPQMRIARDAAAGYSSYGNQIGLATGQVAEFYHDGYLAKHLELGAVIGAAPAAQVRRAEPEKGDLVLLVGGKTGRDGIGGAAGSSKAHTGKSVETAGAEVQKGNAVEERKLQRLFRDPEISILIKRCNDFGAGGVSVAVGELAPGLEINLDALPKKYAGLDGTELAVSESQERMALVVARENAAAVIRAAAGENLDAVVIAEISAGEKEAEQARLRMRWRGTTIVDLARNFLDSNGASRSSPCFITSPPCAPGKAGRGTIAELEVELCSLRSGSRRGLQERFDGTVGAASALFPWGGKEQGTPECGMAALLPALPGRESLTASIMSFGFDPALTSEDPYTGTKGAVKEALAKFVCLGGDRRKARLSMQEYFPRMEDGESWGKPAAALLGALEAQLALNIPAIGGKDSMSGSYHDPDHGIRLAVPPTAVVFASGTAPASAVRGGALSGKAGNPVILLYPETGDGEWSCFTANLDAAAALTECTLAAYPVAAGGIAAALALMAFGNMTGVEADEKALTLIDEFNYPGAILLELDEKRFDARRIPGNVRWKYAARTLDRAVFRIIGDQETEERPLSALRRLYESALNKVYPQTSGGQTVADERNAAQDDAVQADCIRMYVKDCSANRKTPRYSGFARPLVVLPVFPGTNGEWDMEQAFVRAGARTRQIVFRNRNARDIADSTKELAAAINEAQIIALSGGFSAGDEPDGSGKFIANVFRAPAVAGALSGLLENRDGLVLGICNGFQALLKLGLVPYGRYAESAAGSPALAFNRIGRHISRMVRTVVMSSLSPWLALEEPGTIHTMPVSHGEGRFVISRTEAEKMFASGQIASCYAGASGKPAFSEPDNPNGSDYAVEGVTSPDGRIFGKMGHSERGGRFVHVNIPGNKNQRIFEAGVQYFI